MAIALEMSSKMPKSCLGWRPVTLKHSIIVVQKQQYVIFKMLFLDQWILDPHKYINSQIWELCQHLFKL